MDHILPYPVTTFAFYKGTRTFPMDPRLVETIFRVGIAQELKIWGEEGHDTDAKKIAAMKGYLDVLEEEIAAEQRRDSSTVGQPVDAVTTMKKYWGETPVDGCPSLQIWMQKWWRWYTCIGGLLQLGGIKNDDGNGWQIVRQLDFK